MHLSSTPEPWGLIRLLGDEFLRVERVGKEFSPTRLLFIDQIGSRASVVEIPDEVLFRLG